MHGYGYLEGRRTPDVPYHALPAPPPKADKKASAAEKARAKSATKKYNRTMRPALGTATHAIFEALYLQKVKGAWHPPMAWIDLGAAWETRPGQIALTGRAHLPDPASLERVWCEVLVVLEPVPGWVGPWPKLGGTPDLVTQDRAPGVLHYHAESDCYYVAPEFDPGDGLVANVTGTEHEIYRPARFHIYDYKTTLSFDYAKTADYLRDHDEQSAIYALAVMQEHGLSELECTWVYMRTEGAPASLPVHFTMTRAHAEDRVRRLAPRALELEAITRAYVEAGSGFLGQPKRLAIIQSLPTDDSACDNFAGCVYLKSRGGICTPKKSGLGTALRKGNAARQQKQHRREAAKEGMTMLNATQKARLAELEAIETRNFPQNQELKKLKKLEGEGGAAADEAPTKPEVVEASGEEAPAPGKPEADAPAPAKPAAPKPAKAKSAAASEGVSAQVDGFSFDVPPASALGKQLAKAAKGLQAAASAFEGE